MTNEAGDLAAAIHEVARAIHHQDMRSGARRRVAEKLLDWANLVFIGLVVTHAFTENFRLEAAYVGIGLFFGVYLFAYGLMRGGEG